MNRGGELLWCVYAALCTIGLVGVTINALLPFYRLLRRLRSAQQVSLADLRPGPVALRGRLLPLGSLEVGPLTGRPCAFWSCKVQRLEQRQRPSGWVTIVERRSGSPFKLSDGSGGVRLNTANLDLWLKRDLDVWPYPFYQVDQALEQRLAQLSAEVERALRRPQRLRFYESHILPDDEVILLGTAVASGSGYELHASPDAPFVLTDESLAALRRRVIRKLVVTGLPLAAIVGLFVLVASLFLFASLG